MARELDLILRVGRRDVGASGGCRRPVALCRKVTGVAIVGVANGTSIEVAVLLKNPVLRKLSVSCRPSSAPASSVWRTAPVETA